MVLEGALMCTVVFSEGKPDILCLEYSVGPIVGGYCLVSKARVWKVDGKGDSDGKTHGGGRTVPDIGQGYNEPLSSQGDQTTKKKKCVPFPPALVSTLCAVSGSSDHRPPLTPVPLLSAL